MVLGHLPDLIEEDRARCGASSNHPRLARLAPVKAPSSWPNNSLSSKLSERAPQFTEMKGPVERGLSAWMARASRSFPTPVSPMIQQRGITGHDSLHHVHERFHRRARGDKIAELGMPDGLLRSEGFFEAIQTTLQQGAECFAEHGIRQARVKDRHAACPEKCGPFDRVLLVAQNNNIRGIGQRPKRHHSFGGLNSDYISVHDHHVEALTRNRFPQMLGMVCSFDDNIWFTNDLQKTSFDSRFGDSEEEDVASIGATTS